MPTVDIDRDAAHEVAQRELSKPIYPKAGLTERLLDWLDEMLNRLLLKGSTLPGGWLTITLLLILVVVAVVVAVHIARRTMRTNRGADYRLFDSADLSAAEHRATAEQYAAAGAWAAAIRHRLRAIARQLEETGVLDAVPGRTANELARDAGASISGLAAELSSAATTFNDVTYGELPGTQVAYRTVADLDDHLRARSPAANTGHTASATAGDTWTQVR
ncbi:DUF4129 domain-containing protein [soil metagenome]